MILFCHHITIYLNNTFYLNIRVGIKKCQDSRLSLIPSNVLRGINYVTPPFFVHVNIVDYIPLI
jgi:hypothetical protein